MDNIVLRRSDKVSEETTKLCKVFYETLFDLPNNITHFIYLRKILDDEINIMKEKIETAISKKENVLIIKERILGTIIEGIDDQSNVVVKSTYLKYYKVNIGDVLIGNEVYSHCSICSTKEPCMAKCKSCNLLLCDECIVGCDEALRALADILSIEMIGLVENTKEVIKQYPCQFCRNGKDIPSFMVQCKVEYYEKEQS